MSAICTYDLVEYHGAICEVVGGAVLGGAASNGAETVNLVELRWMPQWRYFNGTQHRHYNVPASEVRLLLPTERWPLISRKAVPA